MEGRLDKWDVRVLALFVEFEARRRDVFDVRSSSRVEEYQPAYCFDSVPVGSTLSFISGIRVWRERKKVERGLENVQNPSC